MMWFGMTNLLHLILQYLEDNYQNCKSGPQRRISRKIKTPLFIIYVYYINRDFIEELLYRISKTNTPLICILVQCTLRWC